MRPALRMIKKPSRHLAGLFGSSSNRSKPLFFRYGLLIVGLLLTSVLTLTIPSFASVLTLHAILASKAKIILLALAAIIPMMVGKIDLNVGFGIVLWHMLAILLQVEYQLCWPLSAVLVLFFAVLFGLFNGLLVAFTQIDAFVATLGSGTLLYAVALGISGGRQIIGPLPDSFYALHYTEFAGIPVAAYYVVLVSAILWLVSEHTPLGRCLFAVGANPIAAYFNGIPVKAFYIGAFVTSSLITGFTGVLIAAEQGIGQASVGVDYLLPALVGAFLGSTTIHPGRVSVAGTLVGMAVLAIGIAGIQQAGGPFWLEPFFNGCILLLALFLLGYAQRNRQALNAK